MKILLLFLLLFNFFNIQSLSANKKFETGDIVDLYKDPDWVKESSEIATAMNGLINLIYFQNNLQAEIEAHLNDFYEDRLTNEKLWEKLDSLESQIGTYSEDFDSYINGFSPSTKLTNPNAISLYKASLEVLYDANDYQIENNKVTRDLLSSLAEGDIDKYNYISSRSYLKSANFLELVSRSNRAQVERMPETNIAKHVLLVDSDVINYIAVATRVHGLQILNELDKSKLKEYRPKLDSAFKVILKGKSYSNLTAALENIEKTINELESMEEDYSEYAEIIRKVAVNGKLLSDANIRNAESWKDIMDFYLQNINNIKNLYDSSARVAEFNEIQSRQVFNQEQVAKYNNLYQEASIEFTKIAPDLLNL